jgi:hypothetical protein
MQSLPASKEQHTPGRRLCRGTGVFLLAALFSHSAMAATDNFIDCDRLASNLRSLDVPADEISGADTTHVVVADSTELAARLETENNDAAAPVLLLTPRVATILREVFKASTPGDADKAVTAGETGAEKPTASSPPLVNAPSAVLPDSSLGAERTENSRYVPRFQRQMYRTDI